MAAIEIEADPSAFKHEPGMPSITLNSSASYDCESHRYVRGEREGWRGSEGEGCQSGSQCAAHLGCRCQ